MLQVARNSLARKKKAASHKLQATSSLTLRLGYSRINYIMKLNDFLDKHHNRQDKMRILQKMLKAATGSKRQAISLKKAKNIIFNHKEGDMKI